MLAKQKQVPLVIDTETSGLNPHTAKLLGISIYRAGISAYSPKPSAFSTDGTEFFIAHNGKYDAIVIRNNLGTKITIDWDTMIAEYLLNINERKKLEIVYERYTGNKKKDLMDLFLEANPQLKGRKKLPDGWWEDTYRVTPKTGKKVLRHYGIKEEVLAEYAQADAKATYDLYTFQKKRFEKEPELYNWFKTVEIPMLNILVQAELQGVRIDIEYLKTLKEKFEKEKLEVEADLSQLVGREGVNFNSPQQLREILFKDFKLKTTKKTKTGFSTDKQVLTKLAESHAFPKLLLQMRDLAKNLNTFIDPLIEKADKSSRIHPTYNQALTDTRRFSCANPNLQQIPIRSELGKLIRNAFIPADGHKFLIADYSQIELRLFAHFTKDPYLLNAFNNDDADIHQQTANLLKITRDKAKIFNFSLIYGKTAWGLAHDFNCSTQEAQSMIDKFFSKLTIAKDWMDEQEVQILRNHGWTKNLAGLPLYVEGWDSPDEWERAHAMRCAVNYPIQSSSQDILKKAIVAIHNRSKEVPVLMVHDELVYEIAGNSNWKNHVTLMENAWKLVVPIKVDWKIADRWTK